jgi:acetyltransferase-like isoleucine patch superfamily enzyme
MINSLIEPAAATLPRSEPARWSMAWVQHRIRAEPGKTLPAALALLRGYLFRAYYRARGSRFRAGRYLRVYGHLTILGPGEVIFDDDVRVIDRAVFRTQAREARIVIGANTCIGATEFGCQREIVVGRDCFLARAAIMDTDFHSTRVDRWSPDAPVRVAPVHIGDNVWIAQSAGILPGTRIGDNSVVAFGSVCMREFPANVIIMGNPARVAAPVTGTGAPPNALTDGSAGAMRAAMLRVEG